MMFLRLEGLRREIRIDRYEEPATRCLTLFAPTFERVVLRSSLFTANSPKTSCPPWCAYNMLRIITGS